MNPMTNAQDQHERQRMHVDQLELAERITQHVTHDGRSEVQPGLFFNRASHPSKPLHVVSDPALCVIAQGSKVVMLGEQSFRYDPAHYLINTVDLPLVAEIAEASPDLPYLSIRLVFDASMVNSVTIESGILQPSSEANEKALDVSPLDSPLLDAILRLVRLVDQPDDYRVLAPLVQREIIYRLLTGVQGTRMRHLATFGGQVDRIVQAVNLIRSNFNRPLRIEDVARELHMSVSGFHAHFKSVTAMTPLQFQKQLRLQEARRLMLSEDVDAAQAGFRVGYDDASYFNRDYKRYFGNPPKRDVDHLREISGSDAELLADRLDGADL